MSKGPKSNQTPQPPKGTRDLYPDDLLKRRYIQNAWRDAALRCGFDEIEGPTFESTDLYAIKSGEGILNELFQTFSGKGGQETLDKLVERGQADFALRPEFTPTLARMYAARAKQLPKPCKWFTAGPYFRAERPQRGRLREFLQWNCDIIGLPSDDDLEQAQAQMDAEIIEVGINLLDALGFSNQDLAFSIFNRNIWTGFLNALEIDESSLDQWFGWIDAFTKRTKEQRLNAALSFGGAEKQVDYFEHFFSALLSNQAKPTISFDEVVKMVQSKNSDSNDDDEIPYFEAVLAPLHDTLKSVGIENWTFQDPRIIRGLAYYTGTVFEAIADGERAVAGGGRYDNLIELMGGPPTPAVGFAMGDVVLGNLLDDKHLMPDGQDLMEAVSRKQTSIRPEAFIAVPNNDQENKSAAQSLTATLRRGQESESYLNNESRKPWQTDRYAIPPLHTRISYKSTTIPGKLRADAQKQHAKYFIEIHAPNKVDLTDMDKRESITSPTHASFSTDPTKENYIGTAINNLL